MPVSPQDFALYSRMTGSPVPTDAATRMQMAPDVYKFTKDFAKKPNILEKVSGLRLRYWFFVLLGIMLLILSFYDGNPEDFIYFQF